MLVVGDVLDARFGGADGVRRLEAYGAWAWLVAIALIGTVPFVQMVNPQVPANSIQELIALAKKSPGKLRYGSAGTGASEHLSGVLFTRSTGTQMLHVPYKGIAQAIAATLAGEVQLTYAVYPAARPLVESGRLRAIGVTTPNEMNRLNGLIANGEVVDQAACDDMLDIMAMQQATTTIPRYIPRTSDPQTGQRTPRICHKTGGAGGVRNDSGILYIPHGPRIAFSALCAGGASVTVQAKRQAPSSPALP